MKRAVVYFDTVLNLIQDGLLSHSPPTATLIACCTREEFLHQLISCLLLHEQGQPAETQGTETLVAPTLQMLSDSKAVKLAFCPSIDTLRAYLATIPLSPAANCDSRASLLIMDLIQLHHGTSEFSVQGLLRSLASAVEAAARKHVDLLLCECNDVNNVQNPDRGATLWDARVPLLSGSVKLRGEDAGWSQRKLSMKSIAARWFTFEKLPGLGGGRGGGGGGGELDADEEIFA